MKWKLNLTEKKYLPYLSRSYDLEEKMGIKKEYNSQFIELFKAIVIKTTFEKLDFLISVVKTTIVKLFYTT